MNSIFIQSPVLSETCQKINLPRILSQLLLPPTDQTKKLQRNYNSWTFSPPGRSESSVSQNCLVWLYFYILPGLALVLHFARLAGSCQENVCKYLYGGQLRSKLLLRSRGLVSRYYWHKYEFPKYSLHLSKLQLVHVIQPYPGFRAILVLKNKLTKNILETLYISQPVMMQLRAASSFSNSSHTLEGKSHFGSN